MVLIRKKHSLSHVNQAIIASTSERADFSLGRNAAWTLQDMYAQLGCNVLILNPVNSLDTKVFSRYLPCIYSRNTLRFLDF